MNREKEFKIQKAVWLTDSDVRDIIYDALKDKDIDVIITPYNNFYINNK